MRVNLAKSTQGILQGEEDLRLWSDEELLAGRKRSSRGGWEGARPKVVAGAIFEELKRRRRNKAGDILSKHLEAACETLVGIAADPDIAAGDRLKAATYIIDRLMGKAPDNVNLAVQAVEAPWQKAMRVAIVGTLEQHEQRAGAGGRIIDAEIVDPFDEVVDPFDEGPNPYPHTNG